MAETTRRELVWEHGSLTVQSLGGMLGPVHFRLPDGREASPLHVAPWAQDPNRVTLPTILQELRGEWPCVPFGSDVQRSLPAGWRATGESFEGAQAPHGHSSNVHWTWDACDKGQVNLSCIYPALHPVRELRRRIAPDPQSPAVDITLEIRVNRRCRLPIGLHPTFRLSPRPGSVEELETGVYDHVRSFPGDVEPGAALFQPDRRSPTLQAMKTREGMTVDATRVPLSHSTEELLQLVGSNGTFSLHYRDEGFRARLTWQKEHFPSLLLWYSNRGRQAYPWDGKHLALGVEPICSAFDLGPMVSTGANPVQSAQFPTCLEFEPNEAFLTHYRISAETAP